LCVDDNEAIAEMLVEVLQSAGYWTESAPDGLEAWTRISGDLGFFHAIITDHQMPKLNGAELVRKLRDANYPGIIFVHSSSLTESDLTRYHALEIDGLLEKPATLASLLAPMRKALEDTASAT